MPKSSLSLAADGLTTCIEAASEVLRAGGLVIGPTDTLYGIFALWDSQKAVERLYALKGRDQEKRLLALVSDHQMLESLGLDRLPGPLFDHWPGPLTAILPIKEHPFGWPTQAFRIPDSELIRGLTKRLGLPLYAPSANLQAGEPPVSCAQARAVFGDLVDLYLDGGDSPSQAASTIISLVNKPALIRQGELQVSLEEFLA